MRVVWIPLVAAVVLCGGSRGAWSDDAETDRARAEESLRLARRDAGLFEIARRDEPGTPFTLGSEPILRWTNPTAGSIYGGLFLWTDRGCPQAVAALFKWYSPFTHSSFEFHSLSEQPLTARVAGRPLWEPPAAGVVWKPVPDAPPPADAPTRRLIQMRAIARQFRADKTDREGVHRELRLLTQPLYRFQSEIPEIIDGALFAFAQETDPEVFVLLRARRDEKAPVWQYALARMNSVRFEVRYRDQPVWEVDILPWSTVQDHQQPYTTFRRDAEDAAIR